MIHLQYSRFPHWLQGLPLFLLAGTLLTGCTLPTTRGNSASNAADFQGAPAGGMGAGAVPLDVATASPATPTSVPVVPVATITQPVATATVIPPTPLPPVVVQVTLATTPTRSPVATAEQRTPTVTARATVHTGTPTPARATAEPAATPHLLTYTVQKGDDVYGIARRFQVTPAAIVKANTLLNPSQLKIGQVLHIPVIGAPSLRTGT